MQNEQNSTDSTDSTGTEPAEPAAWLTPLEAARLIGVNKRYIYRLVELGELKTDGKLHGQKITRASAEAARLKRFAQSAVSHEIDQHMANSPNSTDPEGAGTAKPDLAMRREFSGQIAQSAIFAIQKERDDLKAELADLQAAWRADIYRLEEARRLEALEKGQLLERVKNLEEKLAAPPSSAPGPVQGTDAERVDPEPAPAPGRRRWWKFRN